MSNTTIQTNADARYYALLEQLIQSMTDPDEFNLGRIYAVLGELCVILRVSKGVTTFYESREAEAQGKGEPFVCYDSGEPSVLVSEKRAVSPARIVVTCAVYQAEGAEPLDAAERTRVELIQQMMLTFLSKQRLQRIVERMSYWDSEGYPNLRYFFGEMTRQAGRGALTGKAAIRLNLKHFSLINQQIGRRTGDAVMRTYCGWLKAALGENGFFARMGGDNFVAVCDAGCLPEVLRVLRGRAVGFEADEAEPAAQDSVVVSAVAGVLEMSGDFHFQNPGDVMDKVSFAYQAAKRSGEGDIVFYSEEIGLEKERVMRVQQQFAQALRLEEFQVYYQPKVDIKNRELIGAEALCRWRHEGVLISPMEFIPVLERGLDICKLDFYMLDHACRDIRRWLDEGRRAVRVSVNLSRRHMTDPKLFDHIVEIIDRNRVPHEYVEIELTETTTDVEFRDLKRVVNGLQKAGISVSVDDFGVGYSSLNLIKEIPWNVIKLDKSLLPADERKVRGSLMFRHVIAMAHEMGTLCVAEGVETSEQMRVLQSFGCSIAQGFYFDRPLPVAEFENRLEARRYADEPSGESDGAQPQAPM